MATEAQSPRLRPVLIMPWHRARLRCIVNRLNDPTIYQGDRRTAPGGALGATEEQQPPQTPFPWSTVSRAPGLVLPSVPESCALRRIP